MKGEGDTLFVSSNAWLVYWQSDTDHLPKLYADYIWISGFPPLRDKILETFDNNPPTYLFCDNCQGLPLEKYLGGYKEAKIAGKPTKLYVLPHKIEMLTQQQKEQLNFHNINF